METTTVSIKQVKRIKDRNRFQIDHLQYYNLSIQIGLADFQICVTDTRKNRVLLLEDYIFSGTDTPEQQVDAIKKLYEEHHLLSAAFWDSVKVIFKNRKFALVPASVFSKHHQELYLDLNAMYDAGEDHCTYYKHNQSKIVNAFACNQALYSLFQEKYPNGNLQIFHQGSALVEGLQRYDEQRRQRTMFLYVDRFYLHITVLREQKLEYYNSFRILKSEDYLKYILGVMQTLKMDQAKAKVVLFGFIRPGSNHYKFLHQYIRNLSFGHRPPLLKFSYDFDEVLDHQYFDILNSYFCE